MPTADEIVKALEKLAGKRLLVGIPSELTRSGDPITNATLGYIHEMGSPARNIPARPFLYPGVTKSQGEWMPYLRQAAEAALAGDEGRMDRALDAAGGTARDAVKNTITSQSEGPAPIKEETVRRSRSVGRRSLSPAEATPLVDIGELLNSITYVIEDR